MAGPMTGLPEYNLAAFAAAKEALDKAGFIGVNPGHRGVIEGYEWRDYMRDGLALLLTCDAVALLPGWSDSDGAMFEVEVADTVGMPVYPLSMWLDND